MVYAIIPCRLGSKRIKHKNIVDFCGKPMIEYTILAAIRSNLFDKIIISTDDKKLLENTVNLGSYNNVEVYNRTGFSDDKTTVQEATIQTILDLREKPDIVVQLMACCPLRNSEDIKKSYFNFKRHDIDFQISSSKYFLNPHWAVQHIEGRYYGILNSNALAKRSQDLPEVQCPSGAVWIAKTDKLLEHKTFYGSGYVLYELNKINAFDIDTPEDLELAKIFKNNISAQRKSKFKEIERILYSLNSMKTKLITDKKDLEDMRSEVDGYKATHKKQENWECRTDDETRIKQKISKKKRAIMRSEELIKKIETAINSVSESDKKLIELTYFQNKEAREICKDLKCSVNKYYRRKNKIVKNLMALIGENNGQ